MSEINLLPLSIRRARASKRLGSSLGVVVAACAILVGISWWGTGQLVGIVQAEATARQQSLEESTGKVIPTSSAVAAQDADTKSRVTQFNALAANEVDWPAAFQEAGAIIPQDIKLSGYSYAIATTGITLQMGGTAPSTVSFASFAQLLQSEPLFASVSFPSYTFDPTDGSVQFSLLATFKPGALTYAGTKAPIVTPLP
jgi:hypothetical protein